MCDCESKQVWYNIWLVCLWHKIESNWGKNVDSTEGNRIMKEVMNADGGRFLPSYRCWNQRKLVIYSVQGVSIYFENVTAVLMWSGKFKIIHNRYVDDVHERHSGFMEINIFSLRTLSHIFQASEPVIDKRVF